MFAARWAIARVDPHGARPRASPLELTRDEQQQEQHGEALAGGAANHPQAILPIIFYNLVQHLVAGRQTEPSREVEPTSATASPRKRPRVRPIGDLEAALQVGRPPSRVQPEEMVMDNETDRPTKAGNDLARSSGDGDHDRGIGDRDLNGGRIALNPDVP